jgi:pimeloyl-ACP methyl ester carboxylesterase
MYLISQLLKRLSAKENSIIMTNPVSDDDTMPFTAETTPTRFVAVGEVRFAYRTLGIGAPLVLLQRFRGTMDDWDPALLTLLASQRRVIVFDNTGVGATSGATPASTRAMADDAARFLQALDIQQADVVGWSMGGMVAQCLALQHPSLVRRLILAATAGPAIPGTIRMSAEATRVATKLINTPDDLLYLFFPSTPEGIAAGKASLQRIAQRRQPIDPPVAQQSWAAQGAANARFITGAEIEYTQLRSITQPTLVATGDNDVMLPAIDSELLAEVIPNATLCVYPGSGHGFLFQDHEEFGHRILDFLA